MRDSLPAALRPAWKASFSKWALALAGVFLLAAILVNLETVARTEATVEQLVGAQRAFETRLPLYSAATDQQGPLSLLGYVLAYAVGGQRDAWFVVAALIILVAAVTAFGAWITATRADTREGDRLIAAAAATGLFIYLTCGEAGFQHVLQSRNIAWMLFAVALPVLLTALGRDDRRRRTLGLAGAGVLTGLAVQTNPASAPVALVFCGYVLWLTSRDKRAGPERRAVVSLAIFAGAAAAALAAVVAWYAARGGLGDFWNSWWVTNRVFFDGAGDSVYSAMGHGAVDLIRYFRDHPLQPAILVLFGFHTVGRRRSGDDISLNLMLTGWWLAECLATVHGEQFLGAELVPPAVPAGFMAVVMAARHGHAIAAGYRSVAALTIVLATLYVAGAARLPGSVDGLLEFRSPAALAQAHRESMTEPDQVLSAAVAANSDPDSYVYAWTARPTIYTNVGRRAASRYAVDQPLRGAIPSGGTGPRFADPGGWRKWAADLRRTPPDLWIELAENPLPPDLPPRQVRDCAFRPVSEAAGRALYKRVRPIGPCLDDAPLAELDERNARARGN